MVDDRNDPDIQQESDTESEFSSISPSVGRQEGNGSNGLDTIETTINDVIRAQVSGISSAEAIVRNYLERIESYGDTLRAIINVNPTALERAQELDRQLKESGLVGPLHGVPTVLKDNYDTSDMPTTGGSLALRDSVPPEDAYILKKIRGAGAIIVAKANLHEFAGGTTSVSSLGGQGRNPYALNRIPGGSSGGTGAMVAANLCVLGTGSDTGGSIRIVAAAGNQVGLRATFGVMSRDGIIPRAASLDTGGPMTRTVTDTAIALDVMAGYDQRDPITSRSIGNIPTDSSPHRGDSYTDYLNENGLVGAHIGIFRDYFGVEVDRIRQTLESEEKAVEEAMKVTAVVDKAIEEMDHLGATIIDPFSIEPLEEFMEKVGNAARHDGEFKRGPNSYLRTLNNDTPNSIGDILETGQYTCGIAEELRDAQATDISNLDEELEAIEGARQTLQDTILNRMAEEELDAILYPTTARPPSVIGEPAKGLRTRMSPQADMPSISIPAGFTENRHLPVGLELMTRPFDEPLLLELAYSFEQRTDHRKPPKGFGPLPNKPPEDPTPDFSISIGREGSE